MQFNFETVTIAITHASRPALLNEVARRLDAGRGFAMATINMDHIVKLKRDDSFRRAYAAQDIVVADGNPIVWLSRIADEPVELLPGSDLVEPLCREAAARRLPVSIFGATPEALEGAARALEQRIPGFRRGALIAPPMGFAPEGPAARAALEEIAEWGPGLCLIALGAPKQERFAALGRSIAPETGFASVGAGVEFLSGHQNRAPAWVRAVAMEWLWRAMSAPRRLVPRYAACFSVLPGQILAALHQRRVKHATGAGAVPPRA